MQGPGKTHQPCAACRMLRRRCDNNCILAPFFPAEDIESFAGVHKVFRSSNVIKMLKMVEETKREDAVKSIVYEASARLWDPIYGSAGAVFHLQKHVQELEVQLQLTRARILESLEQNDELLRILMNIRHLHTLSPIDDMMFEHDDFSLDHNNMMVFDPVNFQ
ncbi:hypothetical protein HHK36_001347 [Tetracentron sinense]|uniref:LOB domain-containing protein n=1 Tax=Tetracentron sinense TaxID=13715 RepID=A0A834ZTW9_TETSI|nr:hypothetical protein HHK36_001347 [Tetracentron sinense]